MFLGQAVGPLSLPEHLAWLLVLSLFCFLVYSGLRVDSVAVATRRGLLRWLKFLGGVLLLAAASITLSSLL